MSQQDTWIMRSVKRLTQKECANYADGLCLPVESPCHVLNPAYKTIHDGAIACDYFLLYGMRFTVEKIRQAKAGKNASVAISLSSPAATVNATAHPAEQKQSRPGSGKSSAAIGNARKQSFSVTV